MPDFKTLLQFPFGDKIEANAARFPDLYRYGVILSIAAKAIAAGTIRAQR